MSQSNTRASASEEAIFQRLREVIRSRQLTPGTRLREMQIGEVLGASRGTVRKVLRRLAFEGLVDLQPNRGATVAQPTPKDAADLFAARKSIESTIAVEASRRLTPKAAAALDAHIALERQAQATGDAEAAVVLSGEFHVHLAEIADNSVLKRYLEDIVARESLIIQLFQKPGHENCSADDHALIVEAVKSGDPALIAARLEAHIDHIAAGLDLGRRERRELTLEEALAGR